jgi:hypothetical protein
MKARQAHVGELPKVNSEPEAVGSILPRQAALELPDVLLRSETSAAKFPGVYGLPVKTKS